MNAYRNALLTLVRRRRVALRRLTPSYLLAALAAGIATAGFLLLLTHNLAPWAALIFEKVPANAIFELVAPQWMPALLALAGTIFLPIALFRSHRATRRCLRLSVWRSRRDRPALSSDGRLFRLTVDLAMWLMAITVMILPLLIIVAGVLYSVGDFLIYGRSYVPTGIYFAAGLIAAVDVLVFQLLALYRRIVGLQFKSL